MSAHDEDQPQDALPPEAGEAPAQDDGPTKPNSKLTDAERLVKLGEQMLERTTFASDRKTDEKVALPNGAGWFVPRPLTREDVLKLESVQARARTWMKPGEDADALRPVDTQAKRDEYYTYLCGYGIAAFELQSKGGLLRYDRYVANPSNRPTERTFADLDPVVGEWVQLWLEVFNGISDEQRKERGNG